MDFDNIVDRYEKPIFNLIYRMLGDAEEAADVTQETFVAAYRSYNDFRGGSSIYTWLYRIALNRCKNRFKEKDRRRDYESFSLDDRINKESSSAMADFVSSGENPHNELQRKELKEQIEQAISRLPYDYRIVVVLRDMHGLSYQEIAEAVDLSVDVVRTRLSRARGMLRQKLEPYLVE